MSAVWVGDDGRPAEDPEDRPTLAELLHRVFTRREDESR